MRRAPPVLAATALALTLAGCGAAAHSLSPVRPAAPAPPPIAGADTLAQRFGRIPQHGAALGSPTAPFTMVEFADLQCPFCARFDRDVLPAVIDRFVRPGRLRLVLFPIRLLGPDSGPAGAAAVAAAAQSRMWQFADVFYRNQGRENSGYVTAAFIARIAGAVPGLDRARLQRDAAARRVSATLAANEASARTARITGTPNFRVGRSDGVLTTFEGRLLEPADFVRRLSATLSAS